jgi:thioester reductase-like protein
VRLFLTGGTGSVGVELLRIALRDRTCEGGRFLIRAGSPGELEARWAGLVRTASDGQMTPDACRHLRPVQGDITVPGLGLDQRAAQWVRQDATHVLHAAAAIDFNASRADVWPINVDGTRHVLDLARRAARLEALAHISTLYVAGRRTGLIEEDQFEHEAGFVNAYEASKHEAERLVRASFAELPIAVYRLSLLMGRAADGYVHQPLEAHKMFELFLSGKARRVPGHPAHPLDMLPTDYAVRMLHELFAHRFQPGATYHISAGVDAPTGADMVDACRLHLGRPEWGVGWIDEHEWAAIRDSDGELDSGLSPAAQWMFEVLGDYLLMPKIFARTRTNERLGAWAAAPPRLVDYLPLILERCAAGNWGRA